ncbi:MAG: DegT/DnrJ/EryC1/StrS family aminotransferase, partial [Lachnospiraceae bacterium]|nr:DegT/DnrJ/EryC1/StrS family aminotransferase [Lachnospiraceae bacterium]
KFFRGQVDKYRWQNYGSSYLPSDMNAAYLWAQLELADEITKARMDRWEQYKNRLTELAESGRIELPYIPEYCTHSAHMFYLKVRDLEERTDLISHLKSNDILAVFHYVPLHSAPAGIKYGRFNGADEYTTKESDRLVRLPMYYKLTADQTDYICDKVIEFFDKRR